jgi:hypothetical protein
MKIIYNKFLIVSTIILFLGGVYLYFSNDLNSGEIVPVAFGSSLASSTGVEVSPISTAGDKISSDISFLATLVSLKEIKIDTTLFTNDAFKVLVNNAVKIEPVAAGRINPFAPMNNNGITNNVINTPSVITDQPTQITDRTAILNGTINIVNGATDTYFEYGPTTNLGTVTSTMKPSFVGTFIKNVLGLTPKTNYFFKACAKINNITLCGEVVSFMTN